MAYLKPLPYRFGEPNVPIAKFHPSYAFLATAGGVNSAGIGIANLWDLQREVIASPTFAHSGIVTDVRFSIDERWMLTPSNDSQIHVWNITPVGATSEALREYFQLLSGTTGPARKKLSAGHQSNLFDKLRKDYPEFFTVDATSSAQRQQRNPQNKASDL